jgi:hypothetical protein
VAFASLPKFAANTAIAFLRSSLVAELLGCTATIYDSPCEGLAGQRHFKVYLGVHIAIISYETILDDLHPCYIMFLYSPALGVQAPQPRTANATILKRNPQ